MSPNRAHIGKQADQIDKEAREAGLKYVQLFIPPKVPFMQDFQTIFTKVAGGRCLIMTKDKRLGLGPSSTQPGDVVAFVRNAKTPMILGVSDGHYRLVGEAYIHGLMHGEISSTTLQTIILD
jgi:hypothetical protein